MDISTDEDIEAAFRRIRADFEERENEDGLTMLDGFEQGWQIYGRLTDRQIAWLQRQLDGSWRRSEEKDAGDGADSSEPRKPNRPAPESLPRARREPLPDAMLHRRLRQQGKAAVDLERLEEIEAVADGLRQAIQRLR